MTEQSRLEDMLRSGLATMAACAHEPPDLAERLISRSRVVSSRRAPRRHRWLAPAASGLVVAAIAVSVVVATAPHHHPPVSGDLLVLAPGAVQAAVPTTAPSNCGLEAPVAGTRPIELDEAPTGVTVVWFSGSNVPCRTEITHGDQQLAARLVQQIQAASVWPPEPRFCMVDLGSGATLYFTYFGRSLAETVTVTFSGCAAITAPGRQSRQAGTIGVTLSPIEPAHWR